MRWRRACAPPSQTSDTRRSVLGVSCPDQPKGGTMLFRKLFRMLVLGGAAIGTNAGCSTAQAQQGTEKKQDGRSTMDGGTGPPQRSETNPDAGVGVGGW